MSSFVALSRQTVNLEDPKLTDTKIWWEVYRTMISSEMFRIDNQHAEVAGCDVVTFDCKEREFTSKTPDVGIRRFTCIPLLLTRFNEHENMGHSVLFDRKSNSLVRFDPEGKDGPGAYVDEHLVRFLKLPQETAMLRPHQYQSESLQRDEPVCGAAILLFFQAVAFWSNRHGELCPPGPELARAVVRLRVVTDAKAISYGAGLTKKYYEEQTQQKFDYRAILPKRTTSVAD